MTLPIYTMSSTGSCPRVLSAIRLGNKPTPMTSEDLERLTYYTDLEFVAAQKLIGKGYQLEEGTWCHKCTRDDKTVPHGIHVEITEVLFRLLGHLDRRIIVDGVKYPVEIKCLGPASWKKFRDGQFSDFMEYAYQDICYLEAEQKPGVYWVMNRDTGGTLGYVVNDKNNVLSLDGFDKITLPIEYETVVDKLNQVEIDVSDGKLSDPGPGEDCFFCHFRYLCHRESTKAAVVTDVDIVEAAKTYLRARDMKAVAEDMHERAAATLIKYAQDSKTDKYRAGNVSFSYRGMTTREYANIATLRKLVPEDVVKQIVKPTKPFPDYTAREVGKKEIEE